MKLMITQMTMISIMWMLMMSISIKKNKKMKMMSPFECGFNSLSSKLPMSIQFTLLVFMFLLFDIELSILISSNWNTSNINKNWIMTMMTFLVFMMISVMYEMLKKSLKWK